MLKGNNRDTKTSSKTSDVFIANSVANFEHVIIGWDMSLKVSKKTDCSWAFNVGQNCLINNACVTFRFRTLSL